MMQYQDIVFYKYTTSMIRIDLPFMLLIAILTPIFNTNKNLNYDQEKKNQEYDDVILAIVRMFG